MNAVMIIAEAGVNHNGDIETALRLIDVAADAGVDYVKFQTFCADELLTADAVKADYQKKTTGASETQYEMIRRLELSHADHHRLIKHCDGSGVKFFSTAFDHSSIELLIQLGLDFFKIPSGEITNLPYLRRMGSLQLPVILSTGMSTLGEIEQAVDVLISVGTRRDQITVLHCNTEYPTAMVDVHLRAMNTIGDALDVRVGYSDHTLGIEVPIAAVARGACVIEKHFTLDRTLPGPDHAASLQGEELKAMVTAIRNIEQALGDVVKRPTASELPNRAIARKSIVAASDIACGQPFTDSNLAAKRPGTGISPMRWDEVVGRVATRDYRQDEPIQW